MAAGLYNIPDQWRSQFAPDMQNFRHLPTFTLDMLQKAGKDPGRWAGGGDQGTWWEPTQGWDENAVGFNQDAYTGLDSLIPGQAFGGKHNNYEWSFDGSLDNPETLKAMFRVKTGDKQGTNFEYAYDPATKTFAPKMAKSEYWDTDTPLLQKIGPFLPLLAAGGVAGLQGLGMLGQGVTSIGGVGEIASGIPGLSLGGGGAVGGLSEIEMAAKALESLGVGGAESGGGALAASDAATINSALEAGLSGSGVPLSELPSYMESASSFAYPGHEPILPPSDTSGINLKDIASNASKVGDVAKNLMPDKESPDLESIINNLGKLYGMYGQHRNFEDYQDDWGRLMGASNEFESRLLDSYKNPQGWLEGPEGQALKRITENRELRTDAAAGRLSNDFRRTQKLQDAMMQGLNNYRSSLKDSANIGRNAAASGLSLLDKSYAARMNQFNPLFAPKSDSTKNVVGTIKDIWNTGKEIWDVTTGVWDWIWS